MIIFSLMSLSASSLRSVVSALSPPFSPSSHRLLTPLSACKTRGEVRKGKSQPSQQVDLPEASRAGSLL